MRGAGFFPSADFADFADATEVGAGSAILSVRDCSGADFAASAFAAATSGGTDSTLATGSGALEATAVFAASLFSLSQPPVAMRFRTQSARDSRREPAPW